MDNMKDDEDKDVLTFDTGGGRNETITKIACHFSDIQSINYKSMDISIRLSLQYFL